MQQRKEVTTMQTTKEIVNGIWTVGKDIYKCARDEVVSSIDKEAIERAKQELNLKLEDDLDLTDKKVLKVYEYQKKIVKNIMNIIWHYDILIQFNIAGGRKALPYVFIIYFSKYIFFIFGTNGYTIPPII